MLDITPEIPLQGSARRKYRLAQSAIYLAAFSAAAYFAYLILFPSVDLSSSFTAADAPKNDFTVQYRDGSEINGGRISKDREAYFDTTLLGTFSHIELTFNRNANFKNFQDIKVELKKSYQAFLYPDGQPLGFRDGTLVSNRSDYYIVSQGKLRKFQYRKLVSDLGYSKDAFVAASDEELGYQEAGDPITSSSAYPDDSLFRIGDDYYLLADGDLRKFVSHNAYATRYEDVQAIAEGEDFLSSYPVSNDLEGFADGTLIAYGVSAYIVSGKEILPISNAETFESKGFDWNDILNVSGDEFSLYSQALKHFSESSPHPDGTVFRTSDTGKLYLVENEAKRSLPTESIAKTWIRNRHPVSVSEADNSVFASCTIAGGDAGIDSCRLDIPSSIYDDSPGIDYEFSFSSPSDLRLSGIDAFFTKDINRRNFKDAVLGFIRRIKSNYGIGQ